MEKTKTIKNTVNYKELKQKADAIAAEKHAGQKDIAGADYIGHPRRVADRCSSVKTKIVALLHDTIEDTDVTPEYLLEQGFSQEIVDAVLSVTKRKNEDYFDFCRRAGENKIGREVKLADLHDNMDVSRLRYPLRKVDVDRLNKYMKAYDMLRKMK